LIPDFVKKIIEEFIFGRTNPFEVAYVIKQLRENSKMDFDSFEKILHSDKLLKTPSILLAMLTEKELKNKNTIEELVEQLESQQINSDEWIKLIIGELDYHNHQ